MKQLIFLFSLAILLISCSKQESYIDDYSNLQALLTEDSKKDWKDKKDTKKDYQKDCFEVVYPLEITMPDGTTISGNEKDLWNSVKEWYSNNSESKVKPVFTYPIEILLNGSSQMVETEEDMIAIKKSCK